MAASVVATLLTLMRRYEPSTCYVGEASDAEATQSMSNYLIPHVTRRRGAHVDVSATVRGDLSCAALDNPLADGRSIGAGLGFRPSDVRPRPCDIYANDGDASTTAVSASNVQSESSNGDGTAPMLYSLPALHPALLLHCAFARPRSPLLHRIFCILVAAAEVINNDGLHSRNASTDRGSASDAVECTLVHHTSGLTLRLLCLLVDQEARPLHAHVHVHVHGHVHGHVVPLFFVVYVSTLPPPVYATRRTPCVPSCSDSILHSDGFSLGDAGLRSSVPCLGRCTPSNGGLSRR